MKKIHEIFEVIFDNIFDFATIITTVYLIIRQQQEPSTFANFTDLAPWILAVLGLIAVSGLWERNRRLHRIERISKEGRDLILHRLSGRARASDFFIVDKPISDKVFSSADVIYISGMTLTRTTREYMNVWTQRLMSGATIKIMILEQRDNLLEELTLRSFSDTTVKYWKARLETVQSLISFIAKTPGCTGKVELGFLPYIPSYGITMIDPYEQNGQCFVEIYQHESAGLNPAFQILNSDDPEWFRFFREQFEIMWKSCQLYNFDHIDS